MHPDGHGQRPTIQLVDGVGAQSMGSWAWSSRRLVGHFGGDGTFLYVCQMAMGVDTVENRAAWKFAVDFLFNLVNRGDLVQSQSCVPQRRAPTNAASMSTTNLRHLMRKLGSRDERLAFKGECMRQVRMMMMTLCVGGPRHATCSCDVMSCDVLCAGGRARQAGEGASGRRACQGSCP